MSVALLLKLFVLSLFLLIFGEGFGMKEKIIIWDNDGTITGTKDPNDCALSARIILPNVEMVMCRQGYFNVICSGTKTVESEQRSFDPVIIIEKYKELMLRLPITVAVFSPAIGGIECWIIIKKMSVNLKFVRRILMSAISIWWDTLKNRTVACWWLLEIFCMSYWEM